jgi:4-hydroxybenzoate polyprenyltransferase
MIRRLSRWGRIVIAIYVGLAVIAGAIAVQRLLVSTEMPGLAAWELLVLALPWTLALATPLGRQADGLVLAAILLGGAALNVGLLYALAWAVERRRHAA